MDKKEHAWNVISANEFHERIRTIFGMITEALKRTAGPYGAHTMIERHGMYNMTKDGFTVLSHIHFDNMTDNAIMDLILNISHQMVMKVGDGSTSAILAAKAFLDAIDNQDDILKNLRSRDLMAHLDHVINVLSSVIQMGSKPVTDENFVEIMGDVARIATNDNKVYTKFIKEIYEKCGKDVAISKELSPTVEDYYEIKEDLFQINGRYLDKVYCNSTNNTCVLENPVIILFDFTLEDKHWGLVQAINQHLAQMEANRRLLIIAPYYDQYFTDRIRADATKFRNWYQNERKQAGAVPYPTVYATAPFMRGKVDRYIYSDLGPFLGISVINPAAADDMLQNLNKYIHSMQEDAFNQQAYMNAVALAQKEGKDASEIPQPKPSEDSAKLWGDVLKDIGYYSGECEKVILGEKSIDFSGFNNIDKEMVRVHTEDAKEMLNKEFAQVENLRYAGKEFFYAKERLARISCQSATIYVGGNSELDKSMNNDALDDAIKACQSTVQYGYTNGNNLAIINAVNRTTSKHTDLPKELILDNAIDISIAQLIRTAFYNVILNIYKNFDEKTNIEWVQNMIDICLANDQCYDMETEEYSDHVINSVRTDIEILRGAISIIGVIMSANQYISAYVPSQDPLQK
jgi:chaperonin GroEL (HSP60 family)